MHSRKRIELFIYFVAVCFLLVIGLFCLKVPYRIGPGLCVDFDKINKFDNEIHLLLKIEDNKLFGFSLNESNPGNNELIHHTFPREEGHIALGDSVSLNDDMKDSFFISTGCALYQFDFKGEILRKIHIDEFNLGPKYYYFEKQYTVVDDSIWLKISCENGPELAIEWNPNKSPGHRVLHSVKSTGKPDMFGNAVLHFKTQYGYEEGIYCLDAKEIVNDSWINFHKKGFESNSLIYSSDSISVKDDKIYFLENNCQSREKIMWGSMAYWASDGYLYFTRGSSQLWRWNPNNDKTERVFCASYLPIPYDLCGPCQLVFDKSRRYMAFLYSTPVYKKFNRVYPAYHRGVVVFDCEKQKYMLLEPQYLYSRLNKNKYPNESISDGNPLSAIDIQIDKISILVNKRN